MKLTVLGKSPSWQDAGGACSGYLIEENGVAVLLDCGNGVFSKLRCYRDYTAVDAVVISHLHADHFLDLVPFSYALTYAPRQQPVPCHRWSGTDNPARPILFAPEGARDVFRRVVGSWGNDDLIENAFDLREFVRDDVLEVGTLRFRFADVPHFTETFAIDVSSTNGGGRITYGADCSPNEGLVEFARDSDLLIVEATLPRPERDGVRGHLTPQEAAEHASRAGVKRVLLTHVSDELDELWVLRCARSAFSGPVDVAREGAVYTTGGAPATTGEQVVDEKPATAGAAAAGGPPPTAEDEAATAAGPATVDGDLPPGDAGPTTGDEALTTVGTVARSESSRSGTVAERP